MREPRHLFLGTHQDNMDDMAEKGRKVVLRGESSPLARLTIEHVREVRRLVNEEHQSRNAVAARFGLHHETVSRIARGLLWSAVPLDADPWTGSARRGPPKKVRDPDSPIRCGRCGELKPPAEYAPSAVRRGSGYCRPCFNRWGRERHAARAGGAATNAMEVPALTAPVNQGVNPSAAPDVSSTTPAAIPAGERD